MHELLHVRFYKRCSDGQYDSARVALIPSRPSPGLFPLRFHRWPSPKAPSQQGFVQSYERFLRVLHLPAVESPRDSTLLEKHC